MDLKLNIENIINKILAIFMFILPFENGLTLHVLKLPEFMKFRYLFLFISIVFFILFFKKIKIKFFDKNYIYLYLILCFIIGLSTFLNLQINAENYPFYNTGYMYVQWSRSLYLCLIKPLFFLLFSFFIYIYCINSKNAIKIIFKTLIVVGIVSTLYGIYQFIGYKLGLPGTAIFSRGDLLIGNLRRCEGIFYEPGPHAKFLSICFFLLIADILTKSQSFYIFKNLRTKIILLSIITIGLFLTISPIGFIAPSFLLLLCLFNMKKILSYIKKYKSKVLTFATFGLIVFSFTLIILSNIKFHNNESLLSYIIHKISYSIYVSDILEYYNPDSRTLRNYVGLSIFKDYPLLGCGAGNATFLYYKYAYFVPIIMPIGDGVINQNINILAEFGFLGFLSYLLIILYPFYKWLINRYKIIPDYKYYTQLLLISIFYFFTIISFGNLYFFEVYFWIIYVSVIYIISKKY